MRASTSRLQHVLYVLIAAALLPRLAVAGFNPFKPLAPHQPARITVDIEQGDWGKADPRDIRLVLNSVVQEFDALVGSPHTHKLVLRVVPQGNSPKVLYERGAHGEYVVQLTARDERWYQYVYQFSHELCHVMSNFDHKDRVGGKVSAHNQWFEEALCETASLYGLKRLAQVWAERPPSRNLAGYAAVLEQYAARLAAQPHRHLDAGKTLESWYAEHRAELERSPYLREKNELVAAQLLALFERDPGLWRAIAYLNPQLASAAKPFTAYLGDWYAACPHGERPAAAAALALFGVDPARAMSATTAMDDRRLASSSAATSAHRATNGPDQP